MSETTDRGALPETADSTRPSEAAAHAARGTTPAEAAPPARPRAASRTGGRGRTPKQDPVLAQAVDLARDAVRAGAQDSRGVGEHVGITVHEDRLLTHLFDCRLPGYPGWTWYATVARAPRSKHVTVCESGILAGPRSLLAPDWVPWEDRMQALHEQENQEHPDASGTRSRDGEEDGRTSAATPEPHGDGDHSAQDARARQDEGPAEGGASS